MKVLFCVGNVFVNEPSGVMQLAAIARRDGHEVKLAPLRQKGFPNLLKQWSPDVLAYSAMSCEIPMFKVADAQARAWAQGRRVLRVMGGPHATYFPGIVDELELDAVCLGEGDRAFPELLRRFECRESLSGIPNILVRGDAPKDLKKELIADLDALPFIDREVYYEAAPPFRALATRGFMTGRGCPYDCSYCHNHVFNEMFKGCGKTIRKRSVEHVIAEMKEVVSKAPHVRLIRMGDDTFAHTIDEWLISFLTRYKREINLPFYCLMRSNVLTDEMARLLRDAGCISIGMSVESGNERIRNTILHRGLTDKEIVDSFANAHRYGLRTYGCALVAIPGAKFSDDFDSFLFTKKLRMTVPAFSIFSPYAKTRLCEYALAHGDLPPDFEFDHHASRESALLSFSPLEKRMQVNLMYMGTLLCDLPDSWSPFIKLLLRLPLTFAYKYIGLIYQFLKIGIFVFPGVYPKNPLTRCYLLWRCFQYLAVPKRPRSS